jgi:hypothetical protein
MLQPNYSLKGLGLEIDVGDQFSIGFSIACPLEMERAACFNGGTALFPKEGHTKQRSIHEAP